jgi:hypothetical protein
MDVFPLIYRCLVVIKPKQPMLDWLGSVDPSHNPNLEEIRQDGHAYLVPDYEEAPDIEKAIDNYLSANYEGIFLNELIGWYTDAQRFPRMTWALFQAWFEISHHTMVFDTVNKPITKE